MSEIDVRRIEASDADEYVRFLDAIDRESELLLWEPGERTITAEQLRAHLPTVDRTERVHLVAVDGERIVGFLVCLRGNVRRLRHRCDFTVAVAASAQGHGTATRLIEAMREWATAVGITRIELTVMAHNTRAIALYERLGFVDEGLKRGSICIDGELVDERMMAATIRDAGITDGRSGDL